MQTTRIIYLILAFVVLARPLRAQVPKSSSDNHIYAELQAGFPTLTSLGVEIPFPNSVRRIAFTIDAGFLPFDNTYTATNFKYFAGGVSYYFNTPKEWLYAGLNYGIMPINTTRVNDEITDYSALFQSINSNLGARLGQKVYFLAEAGYSILFYDLDAANDYLAKTYSIRINPTVKFLQLPNLSLGVGYKF